MRALIPYNILMGIAFLLAVQILDIPSPEALVPYLLAAVFAHFPLGNKNALRSWRDLAGKVAKGRDLLAYSLLQYLFQWGAGIALTLFFLKGFFPGIHDGFSAILPGGFAGGYGSAAVLGSIFPGFGFANAFDLLVLSSTVGVLAAAIGGVILSKSSGASFVDFKAPQLNNPAFIAVASIVFLSWLAGQLSGNLPFKIPLFCFAFALAFALRPLLLKIGEDWNWSRSCALATDLLVIAAIGGLRPVSVKEHLGPLLIVFCAGILMGVLLFKFLGRKVFRTNGFEKALFTWGWSMGGIAIALGLVQSLKAEKAQEVLSEFGTIYLIVAPFEMLLLFSAPWILMNGHAPAAFGVICLAGLALFLYLIRQVAENAKGASS